METLQQVFASSGQKYGGVTLDLHCNRFGPSALFQICECPLLYARLEVLNISGNRLTDACACYLSTILKNFRALRSLNIEGCFLTSRTILVVADALDYSTKLEQLCIGHNDPISGNALINLLVKLTALKRFSKLSFNGLKPKKPVIDSLCELAKTSSLSALMLGETGIGTEGALLVTKSLFKGTEPEEPVKLDLSDCKLTSEYILKLNADVSLISFMFELNLAGNPIGQEQCLIIPALEPEMLPKSFGPTKVSAWDLNLANNVDINQHSTPRHDMTNTKERADAELPNLESCPKAHIPEEVEPARQALIPEKKDVDELEVADSEEDPIRVEAAASGIDDTCASSCQRNSSSSECQFIQELSSAITSARKLQVVDLSNNGLSTEAAERLYEAWSSSRPCPAYKHMFLFFTEGRKCCMKPCCRNDHFY
ncbi:hypothetical protein TIFTF001_008170 [Ficus carica]|uniref:Protein TONSOKU n=1 Tax=Ficus carica TaxID=3494 RepID=A0AA88CXS1_FICCA|nr:hypothetical protein TIFTF001_008170 [Ficus carica]